MELAGCFDLHTSTLGRRPTKGAKGGTERKREVGMVVHRWGGPGREKERTGLGILTLVFLPSTDLGRLKGAYRASLAIM